MNDEMLKKYFISFEDLKLFDMYRSLPENEKISSS